MNNKILRNLSYGVYIITTMDENRPVGCVANSAMQITSDPATIAVSINHDNYTNKCIKQHKKFALHIMPETTDSSLIGTFGFQSSANTNKFEGIDYEEKNNLPILNKTCGVLICEVIEAVETSTHTIFIGKLVATSEAVEKNPMTYAYYHQVKKGTAPKNAPTFIKEEEEKPSNKTKWVCSICGYVVEADELPDDYRCPICGRGKEVFKKM